jgi:7-carboxy-7-deazaguanine synthase
MQTYQVAERFKSVQGEGCYAGTPMAFIRFVGCSVGKKVCNACDTDFEDMYSWKGGGEFSIGDLLEWARPFQHVCLTGGEPFDLDLVPLVDELVRYGMKTHIETSGTRRLPSLIDSWICVSPKPGFKEEVVMGASEIKVIVPGLGSGEGWPTLKDALRWARSGKTVFLQPRNLRHEISAENLVLCQELVLRNPSLRLSTQLHKILKVR